MKKRLIQWMVTLFLIMIAGAALIGVKIVERYTPTKEKADLYEYYGVGKEEVVILMQGEQIEERAIIKDGRYYAPLSLIQDRISSRFYWDDSVGQMVFTTPLDLYKFSIGETSYLVNGEIVENGFAVILKQEEKIYLSLDFAQEYADFYYEVYQEPNRVLLYYRWEDTSYVTVTKDTQVRVRGGIKSEILKEVKEGERLFFKDAMEDWSCVQTMDGLQGYIKRNCIGEVTQELLTNQRGYQEPKYTSISRENKINLAFHQIGGSCDGTTIASAMNGVSGVNVVAPTWFFLSADDGTLLSLASKDYVNTAHNLGLEVWGLVENMTYEASTYRAVSNMASREYLVQQLISYALEYNLDGINVDFEALSFDAEEGFIQFIRELSIACRRNQIVLSIDNYVPTASSAHYNRKEQGIVADYIIIMGYDEHYAGMAEYGSTASIGFVEDGIVNTLKEVPAHKVINAIPFYTRVFKQMPASLATESDPGVLVEDTSSEFGRYLLSSQAVSMAVAKQLLENHGVSPSWNEQLGQYYGEYMSDGCKYMVWVEDETSIGLKMKLIRDYELAGVAEWSLNLAENRIWEVIQSYLK